MRKSVVAASVAALMMGGSSALASSFTVEKQFSNTFGPNGNVSVRVEGGPRDVHAKAGGFSLTAGPLGDFVAWCLDVAANLDLPNPYEDTNTPFVLSGGDISSKVSVIENLFETGYSTLDLTSDVESGGFQLALWELLYETTGTFDLNGDPANGDRGTFYQTKTGSAQSDAESFANSLLAGLGGPITQNYDLTFLQSIPDAHGVRSQNLVTVTAVPLPAAGILLLAGLAGFGLIRRRA